MSEVSTYERTSFFRKNDLSRELGITVHHNLHAKFGHTKLYKHAPVCPPRATGAILCITSVIDVHETVSQAYVSCRATDGPDRALNTSSTEGGTVDSTPEIFLNWTGVQF